MPLQNRYSGRIILEGKYVFDQYLQKMSRQGKWGGEIRCTELRVGN